MIISHDEEMAKSFYYIAKYGLELGKLNFDEISQYIKNGQAISHNTHWTHMFEQLKYKLDKESIVRSRDRKLGIVDWINIEKKYGLIKSDDGRYMFFINGFVNYIDDIEFSNLSGKEVSFTLIDNPKGKYKKIAGNILIELK